MDFQSIDIFCRCIDNFGDVGVTHRFAKEFKIARPKCRVRVFIDNLAILREIVGEIDDGRNIQEYDNVIYINTKSLDKPLVDSLGVADVMVEMFACHIPDPLLEIAYDSSKLIINLEYLSAEEWVEDYHKKESLLGRGTARKFFFMPGFRETTGGVIINSKLETMRNAGKFRRWAVLNDIIGKFGITVTPNDDKLIGTIFTYQRGFDTLITSLKHLGRDTTLMVFGEKSQSGMRATLERIGYNECQNILQINLPLIDQHDYDTMLCCADFNLVRGEDSLVRAALAGRPFIWSAYMQDEKYHLVKVRALLKFMRRFYTDIDDADATFDAYQSMTLEFNDTSAESPKQITAENYEDFFKNLKKHERAVSSMYYFIQQNCNLIEKFCLFLDSYVNG